MKEILLLFLLITTLSFFKENVVSTIIDTKKNNIKVKKNQKLIRIHLRCVSTGIKISKCIKIISKVLREGKKWKEKIEI